MSVKRKGPYWIKFISWDKRVIEDIYEYDFKAHGAKTIVQICPDISEGSIVAYVYLDKDARKGADHENA
jgi:hypothetical protein